MSVFAAPFTAAAAAEVLAGWPPVPAGRSPTILAGLADQSLLIAIAAPGGTRYRALETIRQYGAERLDEAGESAEARSRHLGWCLARAADLAVTRQRAGGPGSTRSPTSCAPRWPGRQTSRTPRGGVPPRRLLAELSFTRHCPASRSGATSRRPSSPTTPPPRRDAPASRGGGRLPDARRRHVPAATVRPRRPPAGGDAAGAAHDLATAAADAYRFSGKFVRLCRRRR